MVWDWSLPRREVCMAMGESRSIEAVGHACRNCARGFYLSLFFFAFPSLVIASVSLGRAAHPLFVCWTQRRVGRKAKQSYSVRVVVVEKSSPGTLGKRGRYSIQQELVKADLHSTTSTGNCQGVEASADADFRRAPRNAPWTRREFKDFPTNQLVSQQWQWARIIYVDSPS